MENFDNEKAWDEIAPLWGKSGLEYLRVLKTFLKTRAEKLLDVGCEAGVIL
jgi:hypothetical protein